MIASHLRHYLNVTCLCLLLPPVLTNLSYGQNPTDSKTTSFENAAAVKSAPESDDLSTETEEQTDDGEHLFKPIKWGADNEYKLQFGGETRIRGEYRNNFDLNDSVNRDDGLGFMRTRINFDLTYKSCVRAFVELMDSREFDSLIDQRQQVPVDLHQAYLDFMQPDDGPWTLRLGRQELDLGRDRRLAEASNWNNLRRHYDGVKAMYRTEKLDLDLFVLQPNYYERRRGDQIITERGRRRDEEFFYGAYLTSRHMTSHTLEAYFLGLSDRETRRTGASERTSEDGTFGSLHRYTIGSVLYGTLRESEKGELTYTTEGAWQFGRNAKDDIRAYFLRGDLTYEWKRRWKPAVGVVGTLASGDRDPNDGRAGTFDPLFGASHSPYGIMDFVRAENLRELSVFGRLDPTDKLNLQAELNSFWLDSKTDSWSNAPREGSLRDPSGRSGREIGQEISLVAEYEYSKRITFEAGAAHFFPGEFPAAQGRNDGANLFYLQTRIRF